MNIKLNMIEQEKFREKDWNKDMVYASFGLNSGHNYIVGPFLTHDEANTWLNKEYNDNKLKVSDEYCVLDAKMIEAILDLNSCLVTNEKPKKKFS